MQRMWEPGRSLGCHASLLLSAVAGHVRAAASTCLAFLACHPLGAKGDTCLWGPFRTKLLEVGALGALLKAALMSSSDDPCNNIIQQTAAVGIMYLTTMVCRHGLSNMVGSISSVGLQLVATQERACLQHGIQMRPENARAQSCMPANPPICSCAGWCC